METLVDGTLSSARNTTIHIYKFFPKQEFQLFKSISPFLSKKYNYSHQRCPFLSKKYNYSHLQALSSAGNTTFHIFKPFPQQEIQLFTSTVPFPQQEIQLFIPTSPFLSRKYNYSHLQALSSAGNTTIHIYKPFPQQEIQLFTSSSPFLSKKYNFSHVQNETAAPTWCLLILVPVAKTWLQETSADCWQCNKVVFGTHELAWFKGRLSLAILLSECVLYQLLSLPPEGSVRINALYDNSTQHISLSVCYSSSPVLTDLTLIKPQLAVKGSWFGLMSLPL